MTKMDHSRAGRSQSTRGYADSVTADLIYAERQKPTWKQVKYLRYLGGSEKGLTRDQASREIDRLLALRGQT